MSIDLVPLWAAEWTESDKHIKLIGLMTITMKKNNSDQTKGKPWTESVKRLHHLYYCSFIKYLYAHGIFDSLYLLS